MQSCVEKYTSCVEIKIGIKIAPVPGFLKPMALVYYSSSSQVWSSHVYMYVYFCAFLLVHENLQCVDEGSLNLNKTLYVSQIDFSSNSPHDFVSICTLQAVRYDELATESCV